MLSRLFIAIFCALFLTGMKPVQASTLRIAVASNFAYTMKALAADFYHTTGYVLTVSSASSGKLYAQIIHGAPFDIFFSADEARPDRLIKEGKASREWSQVYALGRLVMLSNIVPETQCQQVLSDKKLRRLAMANPKIAPYGLAAMQVLQKLNQWDALKGRLVLGENIAQTLQFVSSGSANVGFVAQSLLLQGKPVKRACEWQVPVEMYSPIRQKMLVLAKSENRPAAKAFWDYMQSDNAKNIIKRNGYGI